MANKKQIWKPQQRNLLDFLPRPRNMVKLIYDQQRRLNLTETKQHSLQLFALVPNTIFCRILIPYSQFCCCSIFPSSPQAALSLLSGWSGGHQLHYNHPGAAVSLSSSQYKLYSIHMWHFLSHKKTTNLGYYIISQPYRKEFLLLLCPKRFLPNSLHMQQNTAWVPEGT